MRATTIAVKSTSDFCKGCRNCYRSLTKSLAINRSVVACFIAAPMVAMVVALIYVETTIASYMGSSGSMSLRLSRFRLYT